LLEHAFQHGRDLLELSHIRQQRVRVTCNIENNYQTAL